jgi:hypothetical protein
MACWYLVLGGQNLPTDIPTNWVDVSTRTADVSGRQQIEMSLEIKPLSLLHWTKMDVLGR